MDGTPNLGAISSMGEQFSTNVFAKGKGELTELGKRIQHAHEHNIKQKQQARKQYYEGIQQTVGRAYRNQQQQQAAQQKQAQQAARAHAAAVKSGKAAPAPTAPPRVFAMPQSAQSKAAQQAQAQHAKSMQQQVNYAHSQALQMQSQMNKAAQRTQAQHAKSMQQQINYAHSQAIQEEKKRQKMSAKTSTASPSAPIASSSSAPSKVPTFSNTPQMHNPLTAPQGLQQATFSSKLSPQSGTGKRVSAAGSPFQTPSAPKPTIKEAPKSPVTPQFADVSPKSNAPYPTHVHPEGSSSMILPHLTESQSRPGKPNQFTVGSRNVRGSGIAAMGSKLEESLATKPISLPDKKRRS